ncbi:hypothetical protein [Bradyrhizobium prioriisuperbiae]|uniref:hypothetical protein n=1 Tax=Bradyrhizobium prioriisuperbiae TaxID=2854389 RepID=UPI0028E56A73|nr:hypothetical protein [Bradyrhizobium prioritasuperba]
MAKEFVTANDLERIALERVRKVSGCTGLVSVTVIPDERAGWIIGGYEPGDDPMNAIRKAIVVTQIEMRRAYGLIVDE